jgi:hypothetical protein
METVARLSCPLKTTKVLSCRLPSLSFLVRVLQDWPPASPPPASERGLQLLLGNGAPGVKEERCNLLKTDFSLSKNV